MNRMKGLVFVILTLLLLAMPLLGACAKEVVKEVPVEKIVEKEVIKEVPVEKVVVKEVIKEVPVEKVVVKEVTPTPHPKAEINILGAPLQTASYQLAFGLSDMINKHSEWLRANAVESQGSVENLKTLSRDPGARKKTIGVAAHLSVYPAEKGLPPFEKPYTTGRAIALIIMAVGTLSTLNPDIKTMDDFVGKTVALGAAGGISAFVPETILREGWGKIDQIKRLEYVGYGPGINALLDGLVDVAVTGFAKAGPKFRPNPWTAKLINSGRDIYWVSYPPEVIKATREKTGLLVYSMTVPAGSAGPKQPVDVIGWPIAIVWYADVELPDDMVQEICRVIYEHSGEFGNYHAAGKAITPKTMAQIPIPVENFHPAARAFYEEKGIKIGIE